MDLPYDLDFPACSKKRKSNALGSALDPADWMNLPRAYDSTWPDDAALIYDTQPYQQGPIDNLEFFAQFEQNDQIDDTADSLGPNGTQHQDLSASPRWPVAEKPSSSTPGVGTEGGILVESVQSGLRISKPDSVNCLYTCAECGQRKSRKSILNKHATLAGHPAYSCAVCSDSFLDSWGLIRHCLNEGHDGWVCTIQSCTFTAKKCYEIEEHQRCTHLDFLRSHWAFEFSCHECGGEFLTRNDLTRHATASQHNAFLCEHPGCISTFTRYPDLIRHKGIHAPDSSRYPCHLCKRHRGSTAFKRKDHLTQHLRNYHHVDPEGGKSLGFSCPKEGCENYRDETFFRLGLVSGWKESLKWNTAKGEAPFRTQAALTKHLKAEHNESQFPCEVPFCDRVGGKGFTRKRDLFKHRQAKHPEYQGSTTSS